LYSRLVGSRSFRQFVLALDHSASRSSLGGSFMPGTPAIFIALTMCSQVCVATKSRFSWIRSIPEVESMKWFRLFNSCRPRVTFGARSTRSQHRMSASSFLRRLSRRSVAVFVHVRTDSKTGFAISLITLPIRAPRPSEPQSIAICGPRIGPLPALAIDRLHAGSLLGLSTLLFARLPLEQELRVSLKRVLAEESARASVPGGRHRLAPHGAAPLSRL
jgi:hypothetical protein